MGSMIELTAADGHKFAAWRAEPSGKPRGGLIVLMEIFGVNKHIRAVTDAFAADGYLAIAPQSFDRVQRGLDVGYSQPEIETARALMQKMNLDDAVRDIAACLANVQSAGKVGIIGYCWGGTAAWKAACNLPGLACAIPYYGGGIPGLAGEQPKCPVQFHWGETDHSIPMDKVAEVQKAHGNQQHFVYPAGHGFNCDHRPSYSAESSKLARSRAMEFLAKHVG